MVFKKITFISVSFLLAYLVVPFSADAATLKFSSGQGYAVGQTFPVSVFVSTAGGESINAVSANISFNPDQLKIVSISKASSVINVWASEPTFSNQSGSADFEGIVLNPGYIGQNGSVATINFKAISSGMTTVSFGQASVLADDGAGTNVLTSAAPESIYIGAGSPPTNASTDAAAAGAPVAPSVTSTTNPDSARWYSSPNPSFAWALPSDVTAVRLQYDEAPISSPTTLYKPAISNKTFTGVSDGTHYLHIQFKNDAGWGAVTHFKFQVDTTAPNPFKVAVDASTKPNSRTALDFYTTDDTSGVDHYDLKVGDGDFITIGADKVSASTPYMLASQDPGIKTVVVNAYDKAGNVSTAAAQINIQALEVPIVDSYPHEIEVGDAIRIEGEAYPDSTVTITLKDHNGAQAINTVRATSSGKFDLIWNKMLDVGLYSFTAQASADNGLESFPTPELTISVDQKPLYRIGTFVIDWLSVVLLIIGAGVAIVVGIMYATHRLALLRRTMKRAITDAEKTVHQRFSDLQNDMVHHISVLETAKSKRSLTKEEKAILDLFKKRIDSTEREVIAKLDKVKEEV